MIDKMVQVSVGPLIGEAIKRIYEDEPVSPLFQTRFQSKKKINQIKKAY